MNWIKSVPIFSRIMFGFAAVLVLMAAGTAAGLWGLYRTHSDATQAIDQDVQRAQLAADLRIQILTARRYEKDAFINLDAPERHAGYRQKWQANQQQLLKTAEALHQFAGAEADRATMQAFLAGAQAYGRGFAATLALIDQGRLGTAEDANREFEKHKAAVHAMESSATLVNQRARQAVAAARAPMDPRFQRTAAVNIGVLLASLLAAASLGVLIARSIRGQIGGELDVALATTQRIAAGNLTEPIALAAGDQHSLLAAMAGMQLQLGQLVAGIRGSALQVAEGAGQIASGNQDLSQRTERQSAHLQEAAASMGALSAMVQGNAERSVQAAELAASACQAAEQGGDAVGRMVATMVRIAAGARQIAEINSVVDGIAFQTNILALNAAVEAARAGEQGRGFAVVASEVRSLAQRSAAAAREIKGLITSSTEHVEAGSVQAHQAGDAMRGVVGQVRSMSGLLGEISTTTRQQAANMGQVSQAVGQLDQNTQQNASLVEQAAAAAGSLNQQAARLVAAVRQFQVQGA